MRKFLGIWHNETIATFLVVGFILLVHALFAVGGYYFGLFLAQLLLYDQPNWQHAAALGYAALVFGGAMWRFVYMPYTKRHVRTYDLKNNEHVTWHLYFVGGLIWVLELAHLMFRVIHVPPRYAWIIALAGVLLLAIAWSLGKILFAIVNKPMEAYIGQSKRWATRELGKDFANNARQFTIEQKERLAAGDMSVIRQVKDIRHDEEVAANNRQQTRLDKKAARKKAKEDRRNAEHKSFDEDRAMADAYLGGDSEEDYQPSSNGKQHPF